MQRIRFVILSLGAIVLASFPALGASKRKVRPVCRTGSASIADDPTDQYLRLTRSLVDGGDLKHDGLVDLLADDRPGNPVDFADAGAIRGGVFRGALAAKLADAHFDPIRARDGLRELAGLTREGAKRRARINQDTRAIVSITEEGDLPGDRWPEVIDQENLFFVNGDPHLVIRWGSSSLATVDLRKGTRRDRDTGGEVKALRAFETTKGERYAVYASDGGFYLDRIGGKGIEEATRLLPFDWRRQRVMGSPIAFTKGGETHLAAVAYDGKGMDNVRATLRWFKFADGSEAHVNAVPLGDTSLLSSVGVGTFGARTLLATSRGGNHGTIRFFDAETAALHWEMDCPHAASRPYFFETGGEPRVAVVGRDKIHRVDPVSKVALAPIAVKIGESSGEPLYVERAGKHLMLIPRYGDVAVVDLDAGVQLAPMVTGPHLKVVPRYAEMKDHAYLTWVDGDAQQVIIADFDQRTIEHRVDHGVARFHSLVLYRDGMALRGLSQNPGDNPSRLTFVREK